MKVQFITILMYKDNPDDFVVCGYLGQFTTKDTFDEAWSRAQKNVIPRLNDWADDVFHFRLGTGYHTLDEFNDNWETMDPAKLLV